MGWLLPDNQTNPGTPAAGKSYLWIDSTKKLVSTDDTGIVRGGTISTQHATAQQTGFAADTYLTGSNILIPSFGMQVGQLYKWEVGIEKTAAGIALIAVNVRIGTNGAIADTSRAAPTQTVAQAATASANIMFVSVFVRTLWPRSASRGRRWGTATDSSQRPSTTPQRPVHRALAQRRRSSGLHHRLRQGMADRLMHAEGVGVVRDDAVAVTDH